MEYTAAAQRIDGAMLRLKSELRSMRDQDVALLRQLIKINETIRKLTRCRPGYQRPPLRDLRQYSAPSRCASQDQPPSPRIIRQFSEQTIDVECNNDTINETDETINSSLALDEYTASIELSSSLSSGGGSDPDESISLPSPLKKRFPLVRARTISFTSTPRKKDLDSPTAENSVYEEILRRNIILWKHKQEEAEDSDDENVFHVDPLAAFLVDPVTALSNSAIPIVTDEHRDKENSAIMV